jgi:hypothetical protein
LDKDICALTYTKSHDSGVVWYDRDKIIGNDSYLMPVNGRIFETLSSGVDEAEKMRFPGLEAEACILRFGRITRSAFSDL